MESVESRRPAVSDLVEYPVEGKLTVCSVLRTLLNHLITSIPAKTGHTNGEFYSTSPFNWIYVASFCLVAFLGYSLVRAKHASKTRRHVNATRWLKRASVTFYALVILFVISLFVCADEIREHEASY